jgi:hypothetical protein
VNLFFQATSFDDLSDLAKIITFPTKLFDVNLVGISWVGKSGKIQKTTSIERFLELSHSLRFSQIAVDFRSARTARVQDSAISSVSSLLRVSPQAKLWASSSYWDASAPGHRLKAKNIEEGFSKAKFMAAPSIYEMTVRLSQNEGRAEQVLAQFAERVSKFLLIEANSWFFYAVADVGGENLFSVLDGWNPAISKLSLYMFCAKYPRGIEMLNSRADSRHDLVIGNKDLCGNANGKLGIQKIGECCGMGLLFFPKTLPKSAVADALFVPRDESTSWAGMS